MKNINGKILERYELSSILIEIVNSMHGYDIIYTSGNTNGYFMRNVSLCEAFAIIAAYMYSRVKLLESEIM